SRKGNPKILADHLLTFADTMRRKRLARGSPLHPVRHQRADARRRQLATVRKGCQSKKSDGSWHRRSASACCAGASGGANSLHLLEKSEGSWTRAKRAINWRRGSLARPSVASCILGRQQDSCSCQDLNNLLRMLPKTGVFFYRFRAF